MSAQPDFDAIMKLKLEAERLAKQPMSREQIEDEERAVKKSLSERVYAHGCVCPVGAERTCQGPLCPRQKWIVT